MPKVHLIGSGFSRLFGYPLGSDFWVVLRDAMDKKAGSKRPMTREEIYAAAVVSTVLASEGKRNPEPEPDIWNAWAGIRLWANSEDAAWFRGVFDTDCDLELLLTRLTAASYGMDPALVNEHFELEMLRHGTSIEEARREHFEWVERVIAAGINLYFTGLNRETNYDESQKAEAVRFWIERFVNPGDVVITTNYDLVLEHFLWQAHRWNPNDGYAMGFSVVDMSPPDMPEMRSPQLSRPSSNLLIKLHGSAGWYFNTDAECAFVGMDALARLCVGRDQGGLPYEFKYEDLVILYPGYLKFPGGRRSDTSLGELWNVARAALLNASALYVIGYSLPPPDRMMRSLLSETVSGPALKQIVVVDPSATVAARYEELFRTKIEHVAGTFQQWVQSPR
jgi:hypothetical protein